MGSDVRQVWRRAAGVWEHDERRQHVRVVRDSLRRMKSPGRPMVMDDGDAAGSWLTLVR
jgi:hypothetical protein